MSDESKEQLFDAAAYLDQASAERGVVIAHAYWDGVIRNLHLIHGHASKVLAWSSAHKQAADEEGRAS